jgi:hypothetical protein
MEQAIKLLTPFFETKIKNYLMFKENNPKTHLSEKEANEFLDYNSKLLKANVKKMLINMTKEELEELVKDLQNPLSGWIQKYVFPLWIDKYVFEENMIECMNETRRNKFFKEMSKKTSLRKTFINNLEKTKPELFIYPEEITHIQKVWKRLDIANKYINSHRDEFNTFMSENMIKE